MRKIATVLLPAVMVFSLISLACSNPITNFLSTRTAVMKTATATQFTPTPTNTATSTPTSTPTATLTPSPTPIPRNQEACGNPRTEFSYILLDIWELRTVPNTDCSALFGPKMSNGYLAAVVFSSFSDARSLAAIVDAIIVNMEKEKKSFQYTNSAQEPFETESGLSCTKITGVLVAQKESYADVIYVFKKGSRMIIAEYTRLEDEFSELDAEVDRIMQSLQFD